MTVTSVPGPQSVYGILPPRTGATPPLGNAPPPNIPNENLDAAPSLFWGGVALRDPEYMPLLGGGAVAAGGYKNQDCGWYYAGGLVSIDQIPSAIATTNIAASQTMTANTPLTLVSTSGAGITVLASAFTVLPTGQVVPAGSLAIDGNPGWLGSGTSGGFAFFDPTKGIARAVSLTSASNLSAINFTVKGADVYGRPMSQVLAGPNATTVDTAKCFKWVYSVTPSATSASDVSVGTSDIYGFPVRVDEFAYADIYWNNGLISASTGFTAADTTSPATTSTGDVRGSYTVQSASDGTKRLQIFVRPKLANVVGGSVPVMTVGLKGVLQV